MRWVWFVKGRTVLGLRRWMHRDFEGFGLMSVWSLKRFGFELTVPCYWCRLHWWLNSDRWVFGLRLGMRSSEMLGSDSLWMLNLVSG